jgi:two-component system CheB/CheR fusion protein
MIYADPARLRQVLYNLMDNAVKFVEQGYIRFGYRISTSFLEFFVEDSGIGIPETQLNNIFHWFRQVELENNRRYGGTGLGLTISRSLVRLMGGNMRVESTLGTGSFFFFTIPYLPITTTEKQLLDKHADIASCEANPFVNKTVIIVESMIIKYKYYEGLLSAIGLSVQQAINVQKCLDFIRLTNRVDAVIVDVSPLEKANSDEIKQIKSIYANLPLILIGPVQNEKFEQVVSDSKCDAVLEDPVNREEIIGAMKRFIR